MEICIFCSILKLDCESLLHVEYSVDQIHKPIRSTEPSFTSVTTEKHVYAALGSLLEDLLFPVFRSYYCHFTGIKNP